MTCLLVIVDVYLVVYLTCLIVSLLDALFRLCYGLD